MSSDTNNFTVGSYWRTREGKKARIICTDAESVYSGVYQPIVAVIERGLPLSFALNGRTMATLDSENDLIEPWPTLPEAGEGWRLLEEGEIVVDSDECVTDTGIRLKDKWGQHGHAGVTVKAAKEHSNQYGGGEIYFRRRTTPVVNWSAMPAWARWVAMDEDGVWWYYANKSSIDTAYWGSANRHKASIPLEFYPSFTGSWTNSLVERPVEGGK